MSLRLKNLTAATYISLSTAVLFLLATLVGIWVINYREQQLAFEVAEEKAQILIDRNLATHTYFTHQLKPDLFKAIDALDMPDYFNPVWMSSTYAVRGIEKYYQQLSDEGYYYKECAINARSPENEADEFEKDFIEKINADENLEKWAGRREINGQDYYVLMRRGEVMGQSCLRCHNTATEAPAGMVDIYGPERSFGRKEGEVVSAISIRIPVSEALAAANDYSFDLVLLLVITLGLIFLGQYLCNRHFIYGPLTRIRQKAERVANNVEALGEELPLPRGIQLRILVENLNKMSGSLKYNHDHLEEEVLKRTQELELANEELERFTYVVAHDLRSPMITIKGFASELKRSLAESASEDQQVFLDMIEEGIGKLDGFIESTLKLSRAGRVIEIPVAVDMNEVVSEAVERIEGRLQAVEGVIEIASGLPVVMGDKIRLIQVVQNLLDNSVKYRQEGQPLKIELGFKEQGGEAVFFVKDNGRGIEEKYLKMIFRGFSLSSVGEGGYGIGLVTVKRIVEVHKGRVWVESGGVGQGAVFYFSLPVVRQ